MSEDSDDREAQLIAERAHLLPEEETAGSDDPEDQAEAILAESEDRTEHPEETRDISPQSPSR